MTAEPPRPPSVTIRCTDRRYCAGATTTVHTPNENFAHMTARTRGWHIHPPADSYVCPACVAQQHPRRNP